MKKENNNPLTALSLKAEGNIYCSLDIETSGFDPLKDEILEVGFLLFKIENSKFNILEEWTKVFKPTKPVEAKILGLTGIKQEELDLSPDFNEYKKIIQEKLGDTVIVGHNVEFDVKFLQSRGIKFSGRVIDTLDLAQWIMPTHHSYNLENLAHFFGIKHLNAHRALADAKTSLAVLTKLLETYQNFSAKLKQKIQVLIKNYDFEWQPLLEVKENFLKEEKSRKNTKKTYGKKAIFNIHPQTIYNFKIGTDPVMEILSSIRVSKHKSLLVLPKKQTVTKLCREESLSAVWQPEHLFNKEKFDQFLKRKLSKDEVRFALKILVWQETNWQTESLIDLNLSFFGGQYKQEISGLEKKDYSEKKILICDIFTFLHFRQSNIFYDRKIVFAGLAEFENAISLNLNNRVAWGQVIYLLKSIYNPELKIGDVSKKKEIESLLEATDLFFGLVNAILQTNPPGFLDVSITQQFKQTENYQKIKLAAESFTKKIQNSSLKFENLERMRQNLESFFDDEQNRVKWLELSEKRCVFNNAPLVIDDLAHDIFLRYPESLFIDSLAPKEVLDYFRGRLGLQNWAVQQIDNAQNKPLDLFTNLKKVNAKLFSRNPETSELLEILGKDNLPAAVLFASPKSLKDFYEKSYLQLKNYASLLSQTGNGSNKLFNNFGINKNSLLLVTDRTILKALANLAENSRPHKLAVKSLVILRLPFDSVSHPYNQALAQTYPNAFSAMALPKALHNLHQLVSFFYTEELKSLYLFDPKLDKDYAKPFYGYFEELGLN